MRSYVTGSIGIAAVVAATMVLPMAAATAAEPPADAGAAAAAQQVVFPPRANSVWLYDTESAGQWLDAINEYNAKATGGNALTEVFSYGTDMETWCPEDLTENCTLPDLQSYYTTDSDGYASTGAYAAGVNPVDNGTGPQPVIMSPVIDGRTDAYLNHFNDLPETLARGYADQVAQQVCSDTRIDGIQFDLEPFDVSTKNGQYYFYLQIAKDFAGQNAGDPSSDPLGCVGPEHPQGRFFSVFTFAGVIKPGTLSASNVDDMFSSYDNGVIIDSLYDLGTAPAGALNDVPTYTALVQQEVGNMKTWAQALDIPYGFGIPASASAHEFETCTGQGCTAGADGSTGNPMLEYTTAAVNALHAADVVADPLFRGTSIWDLGNSVKIGDTVFTPAPPPAGVLDYLAANLTTPPAADSGTVVPPASGTDGTAGGAAAPELAESGSDVAPGLVAVLAMFALGAAAVTIGRRRVRAAVGGREASQRPRARRP